MASEAARAVATQVPRGEGRTVLVAVDGRSGAGKTQLAGDVARTLGDGGRPTSVVHLDHLYPGWDGLAEALPLLCERVVAPLRAGRPASYPSWDWHAAAPGPEVAVPPADVVVVEGVGVLAAPCASWDLRVWVEAPESLRRARALARDGDTYAPHWERWVAQERTVLGPPPARPAADVVVDGVTGDTMAP